MRSFNRRRAISGVSWEVVDGGTVEDIVATGIRIVRAESPLFLRLGDRGRVRPEDKRPPPGNLRRIVFDGISGHDNRARGSFFLGLADKPIENVAIRDLRLEVGAHDAVPDEDAIPEMRGDYPDAQMIGGVTPAYGLWARYLNGLTLVRVTFHSGRGGSASGCRAYAEHVRSLTGRDLCVVLNGILCLQGELCGDATRIDGPESLRYLS